MAIRVVARIRPQQPSELGKDVIVSSADNRDSASAQPTPTLVKIPNPKNEGEDFTFQFSSVYDHAATQQQIFDNEGQWNYKVKAVCGKPLIFCSVANNQASLQWL